jgi:hypothetical protein
LYGFPLYELFSTKVTVCGIFTDKFRSTFVVTTIEECFLLFALFRVNLRWGACVTVTFVSCQISTFQARLPEPHTLPLT